MNSNFNSFFLLFSKGCPCFQKKSIHHRHCTYTANLRLQPTLFSTFLFFFSHKPKKIINLYFNEIKKMFIKSPHNTKANH